MGLRDEGLLLAALARPQSRAHYDDQADIADLAAAYAAGVIQNHPFVDGNKRTGFVLGVLFLELNGFHVFASEDDATAAVLALASGGDEKTFAGFLRQNAKLSTSSR